MGVGVVVLGFVGALFKGQSFAAHGRGGLVTFAAPKVTKRRAHVIRNASSRTVPPHNQAKPQAAPSFPTDRSRWADASESAAMPLPSHRPPPFCLILAEAVLLTAQGLRFFYLPFKKFVLARSQREPACWLRRGNRKACL